MKRTKRLTRTGGLSQATALSRSPQAALTRTTFMVPCGPGWRTEDEAKAWLRARQREGDEVFECFRVNCPKWHVQGKPVPVRAVPSLRPRTETGFPRSVKLAARRRAGGGEACEARCESCGKHLGLHGGQVQHRLARKAGGSRSAIVNGISNAAVLCGTPVSGCHGRAEARDPGMRDLGFWIESGKGREYDPRFIPVTRMLASGERETVFLSEDGSYSHESPKLAAA